MHLRALAGYEKDWGSDHKDTLDRRYNLAGLFESKSMFQDAAKHFKLVVQGYTNLLGPGHPEAVDASERLKQREGGSNGTGDVDGNDGDDGSDGRGGNDGDGDGAHDGRGENDCDGSSDGGN